MYRFLHLLVTFRSCKCLRSYHHFLNIPLFSYFLGLFPFRAHEHGAFEDSTNRFVSSCNFLLLPDIKSISLANLRLLIFLPPIEIVKVWSWRVFIMICSRKMLNNTGESKHTCLTPTVVLKKLPVILFMRTALLELSYNDFIISIISWEIPKLSMICHKTLCHTR